MNWSDVGKTVEEFLPELGAALMGNYAPLVGSAIGAVLGVSPSPDVVGSRLKTSQPSRDAIKSYYALNADAINKLLENDAKKTELVSVMTKSKDWFQRSAYPFVIYCCGAGFLYNTVFAPIISAASDTMLPLANNAEVISMLAVLVGHGGANVLENFLKNRR